MSIQLKESVFSSMPRRIFRLILLLCAITYGSNSLAQTVESKRLEAKESDSSSHAANAEGDPGGWVVAAFIGGAHTASSALKITQPTLGNNLTFNDIDFAGRSFDPPLYYGFRGGYFIPRTPSIGVEAEFIHLKVFSDPQQQVQVNGLRSGAPINREQPLGQIVQQYSISHGVNLLLFNLAARYGVNRSDAHPAGRIILTGRAGVGPTIPHTESNVDGQRQEQYQRGRVAWQMGGGAEVKLWGGLYWLGEYKFTRTRQRGKIFAGEAESLLRTHHGVFGLSYHF